MHYKGDENGKVLKYMEQRGRQFIKKCEGSFVSCMSWDRWRQGM